MILVQKPAQIHSSMFLNPNHRRNPSAPVVVVQPTHTPGLLSLSKPPRQSPRQPQNNNRQPRTAKPKQQHNTSSASRSPQPAPAQATATPTDKPLPSKAVDQAFNVVTSSQTASPAPSPEKSARGRANAKAAKDKTRRSSSLTHSRRNARQPSPPTAHSSQAEAPSSVTTINKRHSHPSQHYNTHPSRSSRNNNHSNAISASSNLFDPFFDSESDNKPVNARASPAAKPAQAAAVRDTPTLAPRPSGHLARRRNRQPQGSPTPARSVPVAIPRSRNDQQSPSKTLSRSVPNVSHMPARPKPRRSNTITSRVEDFPICDDMTEYGGDDVMDVDLPQTPVRSASSKVFDDGPKTAPLSSTTTSLTFPFNGYHNRQTTSSPGGHAYQRPPLEGVFPLSFDDEAIGLGNGKASEDLKALFGLLHGQSREDKDKAPFFASSVFQNSPSPDELPPPSFGQGMDIEMA